MSRFVPQLPPIHHQAHSDNFTLRDLTNYLTRRIDTLEYRLLKVSNITGPHITPSSHRSSLSSVGDCTHYFGLNRRALAFFFWGGGFRFVYMELVMNTLRQ
jgi:hypothetical protein